MKKIFSKNFVKRAIAICSCVCVALAGLTGCSDESSSATVADTVVYGKIYTSNSNQEYVEAFAVKDGEYIYVGSEDGVAPYIEEGTTEVVDYRDKGIVMAGATEGHGHYVGYGALSYLNFTVAGKTQDEILENVKAYVERSAIKNYVENN